MLGVKHFTLLNPELFLRKIPRLIFTICSDITYSTMDERKLQKLRRELDSMRRSPQKASSLESVAARLGRKRDNRGKHPMWMSQFFVLPALSIPYHRGDMPNGTRNSILTQLEDDILAWEEELGVGE